MRPLPACPGAVGAHQSGLSVRHSAARTLSEPATDRWGRDVAATNLNAHLPVGCTLTPRRHDSDAASLALMASASS